MKMGIEIRNLPQSYFCGLMPIPSPTETAKTLAQLAKAQKLVVMSIMFYLHNDRIFDSLFHAREKIEFIDHSKP